MQEVLLAFAPGASLTAVVFAHVICLRQIPALLPFRGFVIAAFLGLTVEILLDVFLTRGMGLPDRVDVVLPNVITFLFLIYCYFHFFNLGETGRRIRILLELAQSPEGLTEAEILARYDGNEILSRRIDRVKMAGQLIENCDLYVARGVGMRTMARLLNLLKRLLNQPAAPAAMMYRAKTDV